MEAATASVRAYQAQLVHGLLQTEDYARAVLRALRLWVIFEEESLRRPVGGLAIMQAQLQHILEAAEKPTITIQVLPTARGAHTGLDGSFSVFEFPDPGDPDVAYAGGLVGTVFVEKIEDVKRFAARFDHLRAAALDIGESADLIARAARDM
jgi:hypothetical protein